MYLDAAVAALRAEGYPVLDADLARLSPYIRRHINVHGRYSFAAPEPGRVLRRLRNPDTDPDTED